MNTHEPTTEPLDDDERAFARIARALPAGDPPAALDARILKAASDAVASRPRRRFAWLASGGTAAWGIGSAAAAVLAIGVAWHSLNPTPYSLPPSSPVTVRDMEEQDSTPVVFSDQNATDALAAAPPPPPPADLPQAQLRAPPAPAIAPPAPPPPPAAPMPFPETGLDEHVADAATSSEHDAASGAGLLSAESVAQSAASRRAQESATQLAEQAHDMAAAKASVAQPAPASNAALGAAAVQRAHAAKEDAEQRVQADSKRYPESWLLKIRTRVQEGDVAGARASLALFVAKYPKHPVPDDLKPLLKR